MKKVFIALTALLMIAASCKNEESKTGTDPSTTTSTEKTNNSSSSDALPKIDIPSLKDEASFLKAWETFTDARMADEKKQKEDKSYEGHYTEYTTMYADLLKATTAFTSTMKDPAAAVAFNEKVSAIQNKMYK